MKPVRLAAACLLATVMASAQVPPPRLMDAPAYQFGNGTVVDMSSSVLRLPANTNGLYTLPTSCQAGQVQITSTGLNFCGQAGWIQLANLTAGKLPVNLIPTLNLLQGTLLSTQFPATIAASTTGNAATATAFAAVPVAAPTGQVCKGIAANGNCIPTQVLFSQLGSVPTLVLGTQIGTPGGIAPLDNGSKVPLLNLPTLPFTQLSGVAPVDGSGLLPLANLPQIPNAKIIGLGTAAFVNTNTLLSTTLLGAHSGVATLDSNGFLVGTQLGQFSYTHISDLPAYILASTKGVANGVASLDGTGKVPLSQLSTAALATSGTPGLVQPGTGLSIAGGVLSVATGTFDASGAAAAATATALQKSQNLGDVPNKTQALTNLGVLSAGLQPATAFVADPGSNGVAYRTAPGVSRVFTAADIAAILTFTPVSAASKGAPSGVAPLDSTSKVPLINLPNLPWSQITGAPAFVTTASVGVANGVPSLDGTGKVPAAQIPTPAVATNGVNGVVSIPTNSAISNTNGALDVKTGKFENYGAVAAAITSIPVSSAGQTAPALITPADRALFASKQDGLGFVPENTGHRNAANGYAGLNGSGIIGTAQLPIATSVGNGMVHPGANMTIDGTGALNVGVPYVLPPAATNGIGGVRAYTAPTHQFLTGITTSGVPTSFQPTTSDIAGFGASGGHADTYFVQTSQVGVPNGVPSLNSYGRVPSAQLTLTNQIVQVNGSAAVGRNKINFQNGTNTTISASDNGVDTTTIVINATGASGNGNGTGTTYNAGTGLVLTGSTFSLPSLNASPGSFGDATHIPRITIDSQGRVTSATSVVVSATGTGNVTGNNLVTNNILVGTGPTSIGDSGKALPAGPLADTNSAQTLTNKLIDASEITTGVINSAQSPGIIGDLIKPAGSSTASLPVVNSTPGTFGSATSAPVLTVDSKGRVTAATTIPITTSGGITQLTGDVTTLAGSGAQQTQLATVNNSPGTYGDATHSVVATVDAKGRVTGLTTVPISAGNNVTPLPNSSFAFSNTANFTVTHNLGTLAVIAQLQDTNHQHIEGGRWQATGPNTIQVQLGSAQSGFVVVSSGSGPAGAQGPAGAGSLGIQVNGSAATGANTLNLAAGTGISLGSTTSGGITTLTINNTGGGTGTGGTGNGSSTVISSYTQPFTNATAVSIAHGLNTKSVVTACYDSLGTRFNLNSEQATDVNTYNVSWLDATSGYCVVQAAVAVSTSGGGITQLTGDATTPAGSSGSAAMTLATVNSTPGTFGSATQSPVLTIDAKGRVTSVSTAAITGTSGSGFTSGTLASMPTSCSAGGAYVATDQTSGSQMYLCNSGTYQQVLTPGPSGAISITGNNTIDVTSQVPRVNATNNFTGANTFTNLAMVPGTYSALPACASGTEGSMKPVTDSTVNTWGSTITGGGSIHVLAYCNGTQWTVAAK